VAVGLALDTHDPQTFETYNVDKPDAELIEALNAFTIPRKR